MHIILSLLGTVVTILVLLSRLADAGITLGGLNPFLWHRRRKWKQQVTGNPVFRVEDPMDASALLITATAKVDGDMSREEKKFILDSFGDVFHLNKKEAASLLISSHFLLRDTSVNVSDKMSDILKPSLPNFTEGQAQSTVELLEKMRDSDITQSPLRRQLVENASRILRASMEPRKAWG